MAICKTEAITLARHDYSETSQVVTFLTRDFGKVRVIAKGAKRPKSPLGGPHDLFGYRQIVFYQRTRGTGLQVLSESKLIEDFRPLRAGLDRAGAASYVGELASGLCPEAEPHSEAFELLLQTLRRLCRGDDPAASVMQFELQLYRQLGYGAELEHCVLCGAPARGRRGLWYSPLKGGALCGDCRAEDKAATPISAASLSAMHLLASSEKLSPRRLRLSPAHRDEIRAALDAQACFVLEREPRALAYARPRVSRPPRKGQCGGR